MHSSFTVFRWRNSDESNMQCVKLNVRPWSTKPVNYTNNLSIDVWFGQYLKIWCKQNLNIEKIIFKDVQIKFLAMHINNQKLS